VRAWLTGIATIMAALTEPQLTASRPFAGDITLDVFANA
jgi:hypothetical protein